MSSPKYYKGPALVAGVKNLNDRFYTNETAADIVRQFLNMQHPVYGELIISDDWNELTISKGATNLSRVSHKIVKLETKMTYDHLNPENSPRTDLEVEIEFVDNDLGRMASDMIGGLTMSLRGIGVMRPFVITDPKSGFFEGESLGMKVADYEFLSIDLIRKETSSFNGIFK